MVASFDIRFVYKHIIEGLDCYYTFYLLDDGYRTKLPITKRFSTNQPPTAPKLIAHCVMHKYQFICYTLHFYLKNAYQKRQARAIFIGATAASYPSALA